MRHVDVPAAVPRGHETGGEQALAERPLSHSRSDLWRQLQDFAVPGLDAEGKMEIS